MRRPTDATITFSKDAHKYVCMIVHLSTGMTAQAKAHANEIYAAFEGCREKMDKQLRRYKRRLKDHHKERSSPVELMRLPRISSPRRTDRTRLSQTLWTHDHR